MWRNFRFWQVYGYNRDNFMEDREQRAISMFYLDTLTSWTKLGLSIGTCYTKQQPKVEDGASITA